MSERAVDPARSRIILFGPAYYEDPKLPNVPVIADNITDLARVLTDAKLGGFSPFHCVSVPSTAGVAQVGDMLVRAAEEAEDLLLFYYSGHGLLGARRRELYLSLAETRRDQLAFTALPFEAVREACLDSRATNRVVILDSCFSGRAIGDTLTGVDEAVLGELEVSGTYTLTSSPANRTALVLPGEKHTAFTERLLTMLEAGSPTAGTMISLGDIYRHLHTRLRAEGLPVPQRCGVNNADLLGLVRNVHSADASGDAQAAANTAVPAHVPSTAITERLTHAESIANTIGDGYWRTLALTRVALAAADTLEPEHVKRLIDKAERAAGTLGQATTEALAAIVAAVGVLDPDRAERIAQKAARTAADGYVLSALAKAVAASDPDRAEHIANAITIKYQRCQALSAVASAVAADDLDRAERIANYIAEESYRWPALSAMAAAVATTNPDRAETIANAIADKDYRWPALSAVAAAVAITDPDRAERIANEMTRKYNRWWAFLYMQPMTAAALATALGTVAAAVAADDPDRAERIANSITHKPTSEDALATVAKTMAATDPDRAERIANSITDKYTQVTVLIAVTSAVAISDPDRADSLIHQAERAASMVKPHARTAALTSVAVAAAAFDPDRAEGIAQAVSHKATKERLLVAVGQAVAVVDPDRAERIASTLTDEFSAVRIRSSVARAVAMVDLDRARRIAHQVPGAAKAELLHSVVLVLTDPTR
ncbi:MULTISPECIES: caspase family protein [unclassified Streptomyces]|uniref:caspase, EACC1-associated type n=1 Tax=unclassified Streptomyces TaxID=2593676 RepID=UPI00224DEF4B|nr:MULTISPECIES: caspase family protein [unclassified Streptomyces]MCX5056904.1 caspase family protein [Streptomyces sp. NBC_00452]MCX5287996.1 caspase family protein [Streptomyces sp. NBC_00183]